MYGEILQALKSVATEFATGYSSISLGAMPQNNGLAMVIGSGAETERYLCGGMQQISIVINGKHSNQQTVLTALSDIHQGLSRQNYTNNSKLNATRWQITNITTSSSPNYLKFETADKQWLYGSIIQVDFAVKY